MLLSRLNFQETQEMCFVNFVPVYLQLLTSIGIPDKGTLKRFTYS